MRVYIFKELTGSVVFFHLVISTGDILYSLAISACVVEPDTVMVVRKILDCLDIYEFRRDRPPPRVLAIADTFNDFECDDHINNDYTDF